MQYLASSTVAELSIEWCIATYLEFDAPAVAMSYVHGRKGRLFRWLFIRGLGLPRIVRLIVVTRRDGHSREQGKLVGCCERVKSG